MRAVYVLLCDFALISADGKPSIVGVFDALRAPSAPFAYPRFVLASRIEFDGITQATNHTVQITVQDPNGSVLLQTGGPLTLNPSTGGHGKVSFDPHVVLDGLVFQLFGTYTFSIAVDGVLLGSAQLLVIQSQGS